jgi:Tol biopolymer transport system component
MLIVLLADISMSSCHKIVNVTSGEPEANPKLIVFPKPEQYSGEWYDLSWSRLGDKIALVADGALLVMNADGTEIQEIAHQPTSQTEWRSPSWSADGSKIFAGDAEFEMGAHGYETVSYIYVMNVDGSNKIRITRDARMPALSSDGSKIAFSKGWLGGLWIINVDGSSPHMVLSSNDSIFEGHKANFEYVDWSPDDSKIVACVEEYGGSSNNSIWIVNADGSNPTRVFWGKGGGLAYKSVHWSPDGTKIIFSLGVEEEFGTWIMNAEGSNKTLLIKDGSHATWSPDGKKIAYYGGIGIYMLDLQALYVLPPDSDRDGLPDGWEYGLGLNLYNASDAHEDSFDGDGLTNLEEYIHKTSITNVDTDDDGLSDGLEVHVFGTDPTKKDTDGDGISDGLEAVAAGFNAHVMILPKNWIKVQLLWSNFTMDVATNSSVIGVMFNSTSKQLTVNVAGLDGTVGVCNLTVPKSLVSSSSNIKIYLDNQPLYFSLSEGLQYYYISVEYTHSTHMLLASFAQSAEAVWDYTLYIITGTVVAIFCMAIIIVFRIRRYKNDKKNRLAHAHTAFLPFKTTFPYYINRKLLENNIL